MRISVIILLLALTIPAQARLRVAQRSKLPVSTDTTQNVTVTKIKSADCKSKGSECKSKSADRKSKAVERKNLPQPVFPEPVPATPKTPAIQEVAPVATSVEEDLESLTIMGEPQIAPEVMAAFVQQHNPDFDASIAHAFFEVGKRYGIRGDIALCQSILETGWFKFADGTAVKPEQHNYCGLGVTTRGVTGHSFDSVELGVTAQIQHLYAYATALPLPENEPMVDPRFRLVNRGVAPTWRDLNRRWAMNDRYSASIINLFKQLITYHNQCE